MTLKEKELRDMAIRIQNGDSISIASGNERVELLGLISKSYILKAITYELSDIEKKRKYGKTKM